MLYAKIDSEGNVIEFPYRVIDDPRLLGRPGQEQELPEDAVEVDTVTNRPETKWDESAAYGEVSLVDGAYVLSYDVVDRFAHLEGEEKDAERLKTITTLVRNIGTQAKRTFEYQAKQLKGEYPEAETESWAEQVSQARLLLQTLSESSILLESAKVEADLLEELSPEAKVFLETVEKLADRVVNKSPGVLVKELHYPLIDSIAASRGLSVEELATRIVRKAESYQRTYGTILGEYHRITDILESIDFENPNTWNNINDI